MTLLIMMMAIPVKTGDKKVNRAGFTLSELVVVMMIISVMTAVILPYATRSNNTSLIKQDVLNIAEAVKYSVNYATDKESQTRIVIDTAGRSYWVEALPVDGGRGFESIDNFQGQRQYYNAGVHLTNLDGFEVEGAFYYLFIDPAKPWPNARLSLSTDDIIQTIVIAGKRVEIVETTIYD